MTAYSQQTIRRRQFEPDAKFKPDVGLRALAFDRDMGSMAALTGLSPQVLESMTVDL
ncbi:MAG: hypothetical protein AAF171_24715 [Cyanobacteria bacterium P01_A01_bin.116]